MLSSAKKLAVGLAGAAVIAGVAYAAGTEAGGGLATASNTTNQSSPSTPWPHRMRPGFMLGTLASRLGVDENKLRSALQDIRGQQPRPAGRTSFAADLAKALGLPEDRVTAALAQVCRTGPGPGGGMRAANRGAFADDLAKALNVDAAKVRGALDKLRSDAQARRSAHRDAFANALAQRLGIDPAKVKSALNDLGPRGRPGRMGGWRDGDGGPPAGPHVTPGAGGDAMPRSSAGGWQ